MVSGGKTSSSALSHMVASVCILVMMVIMMVVDLATLLLKADPSWLHMLTLILHHGTKRGFVTIGCHEELGVMVMVMIFHC